MREIIKPPTPPFIKRVSHCKKDTHVFIRIGDRINVFIYLSLFIKPGRGHMAPLPKIPEKCPLGLKLGRVPQGGLNITFKPKKSQPSTFGFHKGIMKIAP